MLGLLRRKAQSPIIQATVVIIAVVFIFWGAGSSRQGSKNTVATVNDYSIPYQEFQQAYDRVLAKYRDQLGGNLPAELLKQLGIEKQVLNQLIHDVLLRQGAAEMGIMVSNIEVTQAVQEMGAFSSNGVFDMKQYKTVLSRSKLTPAAFEQSMRSDMLSGKVMDHLARFTDVLPTEVRERFVYENEEESFDYLSFAADNFRDKVVVTDARLVEYYEKNKNNYMTDKQIKLDYLVFPFADERQQVEVAPAEILAYYQQNINKFSIPEKRLVRHIFIKTEDGDSDEVLAGKRRQAEEVLAKARSGADFAELAARYSEDKSADSGNLVYMVRGEQLKSLDDAVFSLAKGEISDLLQTSYGFHLIKVEEIQPAVVKEIEEVKSEIADEVRRSQGNNIIFARASQAYEKIIQAGSLEKYSASAGIPLIETGFFVRESPPVDADGHAFSKDPGFLNAAFSLMAGELSSLVETEKGYTIIYAKEIKEPAVSPLAAVREKVVSAYLDEQAGVMARQAAEGLLAAARAAQKQGGWEEEARKRGVSPLNSGFVSRRDATVPAKLNLPAGLLEKVSRLSVENPYPEEIEAWDGTYYVYRFRARKEPAADLLAEKADGIKSRLLQEKGLGLLAAWLENRKSNSEIVISEQFKQI